MASKMTKKYNRTRLIARNAEGRIAEIIEFDRNQAGMRRDFKLHQKMSDYVATVTVEHGRNTGDNYHDWEAQA